MANMSRRYPYGAFIGFAAHGTGAGSNITVTGIATTDVLVAVWRVSGSTAGLVDSVTDETSITAANTIQLATTASNSDYIMGFYIDVSIA